MSARKLALSALFVCFAAALSALETMLPPVCPIAGVRVGLGNIVTMFVLCLGGMWHGGDAFAVAVLRCVLAALVTGSVMNAAYGISGGLAATGAMMLAMLLFSKKENGKRAAFDMGYLPFVGVAGAAAHIAGQSFAAVFFYGTTMVLAYIPILLVSAVVGGVFTGLCTMLLIKKLDKKILDSIR